MCVVWWISDEFLSGISEACWVAHIRSPRLPRMYFLDWSDGWYSDRAMRPWDQVGDGGDMCPCAILRLSMCRVPRAGDLITLSRGDYWLQTPADSCFLARQWAKILTKSPVTISSLATLGGGPGHKMWSRTMNEWMKQIKCMQRL